MRLGHAAGRKQPERDRCAPPLQALDDAVQLLPQVAVGDPAGLVRQPPPPPHPLGEPPRRAERDVLEVRRDDDAPPALLLPGAELEGRDHGPQLRPVARRVARLAARPALLQREPNRAPVIVVDAVPERVGCAGAVSSRALVREAAAPRRRDAELRPIPVVDAAPVDEDQDLAAVVAVDEARLSRPRGDGLQGEVVLGRLVGILRDEDRCGSDVGALR